MPRGKRECKKCEQMKGNRAFEPGSPVCKGCNGTTPAAAPKSPRKPRAEKKTRVPRKKKLRAIVNRHVRRGAEDPALAALRAKREQLSRQLGAVDQAIEALEKAA